MDSIKNIYNSGTGMPKLLKSCSESVLLQKNWTYIFGKLAKDVSLGYLKDGCLHLDVRNYMWVSELDYYKVDLLVKINEVLKKKTAVTQLRIAYKSAKKSPVINSKKYVRDTSLTLPEKIVAELKLKKKMGYKLCVQCALILCENELCYLCRASQVSKSLRTGYTNTSQLKQNQSN